MSVPPRHAPGPPVAFTTTRWSLVLAAREGGSDEARSALEALFAAYWLPLYAFIRGRGYPPADAEDLTQGFFERLLEKDVLGAVDQEKGRFRSFLLAACKDFLANRRDHANAKKRGGGRRFVPIDAESRLGVESAASPTPEDLFDRRWAIALLDLVLERLAEEADRGGRRVLFERLKPALTGDDQAAPHARVAEDLGMKEGAVRTAVHRLRCRYRELLREEIARTVASPDDVDEEIRDLFRACRS